MTSDVNLDKSDLSSAGRVQIIIGRYFSQIYFAIAAEEIQITQNLIFTLYFHLQYVLLKIRKAFLKIKSRKIFALKYRRL